MPCRVAETRAELGHGLSCVLLQRHLVSDCRKSGSPGPGVSECSRITLGWVLGLQMPEVVEPHLCNRAPVLNKLPRSPVPRNSDCASTRIGSAEEAGNSQSDVVRGGG